MAGTEHNNNKFIGRIQSGISLLEGKMGKIKKELEARVKAETEMNIKGLRELDIDMKKDPIGAIKHLRGMYQASLKDAKDAIEIDRTWTSAHAHLSKLGYQIHREPVYELAYDPIGEVQITRALQLTDMVNNPSHYGGKDNPYEVIKVLRAWKMNFHLGNAVKYIARAGKKDPLKTIEDLEKAIFYIQDEINALKSGESPKPTLRQSGAQ